VLPAELAYGALITALGSDADAVAKDLEAYPTAQPPDGAAVARTMALTTALRSPPIQGETAAVTA